MSSDFQKRIKAIARKEQARTGWVLRIRHRHQDKHPPPLAEGETVFDWDQPPPRLDSGKELDGTDK